MSLIDTEGDVDDRLFGLEEGGTVAPESGKDDGLVGRDEGGTVMVDVALLVTVMLGDGSASMLAVSSCSTTVAIVLGTMATGGAVGETLGAGFGETLGADFGDVDGGLGLGWLACPCLEEGLPLEGVFFLPRGMLT